MKNDHRSKFRTWTIGHVWYINIQALLRGFRVTIANFSSFFCSSIPKRDLDTKKTPPNIEFRPESLGAMLEYWYIERGLLERRSLKIASHRYRQDHGFEFRWSPDFFQASSFQLFKLENYCNDHSSLWFTPAVQIWIISYIRNAISLLTGDMNSINWPRS